MLAFVAGTLVGVFIGIVLCFVAGWRAGKALKAQLTLVGTGLDLSPTFATLAYILHDTFERSGAPSFLTISVNYRHEGGVSRDYLLTIKRADAESPELQCDRLRREIASLRSTLDRLEALCDEHGIDKTGGPG